MKTTRKILLCVLMFALAILTGCSSDDNPMGPALGSNAATTEDGALELSLSSDKASYAFGDDVTITLSLRNTGNSAINLDFDRGTPARYPNLSINVKDTTKVSHFVQGEGTADVTSLAAGAAITYSWVWDQTSRFTRRPVDRGTFELVGFTAFDDRDLIRVEGLFIELK